jgi:hypothetical protein
MLEITLKITHQKSWIWDSVMSLFSSAVHGNGEIYEPLKHIQYEPTLPRLHWDRLHIYMPAELYTVPHPALPPSCLTVINLLSDIRFRRYYTCKTSVFRNNLQFSELFFSTHSIGLYRAVLWLRWLVAGISPRVRARFSPCKIYGGQIGTGAGFYPSSPPFPCRYHSTVALYTHISPGERKTGPLLAAVQRQSHPIDINNINILLHV